jgi:hypothetical protein
MENRFPSRRDMLRRTGTGLGLLGLVGLLSDADRLVPRV